MKVNSDTRQGPSFSMGNRLARALWGIVWLLLFRFSPRPLHGWRALLLRLFGAKLGQGCHIYGGVRIWAPWNLTCGAQVGVADGVNLYTQAPIYIGDRVVISQGSHLCTGTHDYESPGFPLVAHSIRIESDAWIAAECFIMPGVTVGQGTVAGARSVITKDLPAWTICAGHPCKALRPRQPKDHARFA